MSGRPFAGSLEASIVYRLAPSPVPVDVPRLVEETGRLDEATVNELQRQLDLAPTGVLDEGTVRALKERLGVHLDEDYGGLGSTTIRALHVWLRSRPDGVWTWRTTKALQRALRAGRL